MSVHIIYQHVRGLIEDLHHVPVPGMHDLVCRIHGKGHIVSRGMPVWIHKGRYRAVGLCIEFLLLAVTEDICSSEFRTHMEKHVLWIAVAEAVTVHAVSLSLKVAVYLCLLVVLKIPLTYAHLLPHRISRRDESVCEIWVYLIFHYRNRERTV